MSFTASLCPVHNTAECPCKKGVLQLSLHTAAAFGDLPRVRELVEQRGKAADAPDKHGYTALHFAAQRGHLTIVQYLLTAGADVNACQCGCTALHRAAYTGNLAAVQMLVEAGAVSYTHLTLPTILLV